ncbi:MAG: helix-turn-helix domain-containing protein [Planctomycetia bacterium]
MTTRRPVDPMDLDALAALEPRLVVADENRLAVGAVARVAAAPGEKFNPLVLWGPPGVGKSFLLEILGTAIRRRRPEWRVAAWSAGDFIAACDRAWRPTVEPADPPNEPQDPDDDGARDRSVLDDPVDVFLLDDVHLLTNHPAAWSILDQRLQQLLVAERPVALTVGGAVGDLTGAPPRLRARLAAGLCVGLMPFGVDARRRVAETLGRSMGLTFGPAAVDLLTGPARDVRELVGRVRMVAAALGRRPAEAGDPTPTPVFPIDRPLAAAVLGDPAAPPPAVQAQTGDKPAGTGGRWSVGEIAEVARVVAKAEGVTTVDLRSAARRPALVRARQIAMFLVRKRTAAPLMALGKYFGGRDHATVLYGVHKIEAGVGDDPALAGAVERIEAELDRRAAEAENRRTAPPPTAKPRPRRRRAKKLAGATDVTPKNSSETVKPPSTDDGLGCGKPVHGAVEERSTAADGDNRPAADKTPSGALDRPSTGSSTGFPQSTRRRRRT